MGSHIVEGQFQSDKYPSCPSGKVPLSIKDPTAQDLLWAYAQRRRVVDKEFSADLELALQAAGFVVRDRRDTWSEVDMLREEIRLLREALLLAESIRDEARAASNRDIERRREIESLGLTKDELTILSYLIWSTQKDPLKDTYELGDDEPDDPYVVLKVLRDKVGRLKPYGT